MSVVGLQHWYLPLINREDCPNGPSYARISGF
jgi:hypothetical protein